jgi:hypothetical protein
MLAQPRIAAPANICNKISHNLCNPRSVERTSPFEGDNQRLRRSFPSPKCLHQLHPMRSN